MTNDLRGNRTTHNIEINKGIPNNVTLVNGYRRHIIDMIKNIYDPVILKYIYELTCKYYNH